VKEAQALSARIADAMTKVLPIGFRGKVTFIVDRSEIQPSNVTVLMEFRPPQPKAGMRQTMKA
jgi:hypothetical protein